MAVLVKELRTKRAKAVKDARSIFERAEKEKRAMSAEEREQFDKFMGESTTLKGEIDAAESELRSLEALEAAEKELEETPGRKTDPGTPGWQGRGTYHDGEARRGEDGEEVDEDGTRYRTWKTKGGQVRKVPLAGPTQVAGYRKAYRNFLAAGQRSRSLIARDAESRDLQADVDTQAGYMVAPMQMAAGLIKFLDDQVFVRQFATVEMVTNAQSLGAVSLDADPDDGEWTSEITIGSADTAMKFGRRELNPTLCSKQLKISRKLLRLSSDIENLVINRLGYKFAVTEEKNYLTGDGANKPLGLFTASSSGISTGRDVSTGNTTTQIRADNLISCKYALKAGYRGRPSTRWIFHRDAMLQIALLKDGNGQYLWRQGLVAGEPDTVLNIPAAESEFAPNTFTTGKYVGLLGDLSFYWIAQAMGLDIQRLEELFALQNQIGLVGRLEADGMPVLEEAFVRVKLG